jgi:hypothetical protein
MQYEIPSRMILSQLKNLNISTTGDNTHSASLSQIKMWIIPQKAEHDDKYDINRGYFELLVQQTMRDLITNGYIKSSHRDEAEDGDGLVYSLTEKGERYLEEMTTTADKID